MGKPTRIYKGGDSRTWWIEELPSHMLHNLIIVSCFTSQQFLHFLLIYDSIPTKPLNYFWCKICVMSKNTTQDQMRRSKHLAAHKSRWNGSRLYIVYILRLRFGQEYYFVKCYKSPSLVFKEHGLSTIWSPNTGILALRNGRCPWSCSK